MPPAELVLYQEEFQRLDQALKKLRQDANARAIFLIDRTGQQIAAAGEGVANGGFSPNKVKDIGEVTPVSHMPDQRTVGFLDPVQIQPVNVFNIKVVALIAHCFGEDL